MLEPEIMVTSALLFGYQITYKNTCIYNNNNLYSYITGRTDGIKKIIFNLIM